MIDSVLFMYVIHDRLLCLFAFQCTVVSRMFCTSFVSTMLWLSNVMYFVLENKTILQLKFLFFVSMSKTTPLT